MKCKKCQIKEANSLDLDGYCWDCNDDEIVKSVYKPKQISPENRTKALVALSKLGCISDQDIANALTVDLKPTMTLPTDSTKRKEYPIFRGVLRYFPAALAGISNISQKGNNKHNPGEEMYHARGKSTDHGDCILRHLTDTEDLLAAKERGGQVTNEQILEETSQLAWRVLAYSQEIHESLGSPLAPGAKK